MTKFVRLQRWLARNRNGFKFGSIGKEFRAPYPSTPYTYLNALVREGIVKRVKSGFYVVPNTDKLWRVTLQSLATKNKIRKLEAELKDYKDAYNKMLAKSLL